MLLGRFLLSAHFSTGDAGTSKRNSIDTERCWVLIQDLGQGIQTILPQTRKGDFQSMLKSQQEPTADVHQTDQFAFDSVGFFANESKRFFMHEKFVIVKRNRLPLDIFFSEKEIVADLSPGYIKEMLVLLSLTEDVAYRL